MTTPLHESALEYAADVAASARGITPLEPMLVRAFMAGDLEASRRKPHHTLRVADLSGDDEPKAPASASLLN